MRCVVVSTDPAVVAACSAAVDGAAGIDVVAAVSRSRVLGGSAPACDVLLVADAPGASAAGWAHEAVRACPHAAVVLLTEDASVETYRAALRAGVRAVVDLPMSTAALASGIADAVRASGPEAAVPSVRAAGVVSAVAGARGGVGASAVALALAAGARALLIDLAAKPRGSGIHAGLAPGAISRRPRPGGRGARGRDRHGGGRASVRAPIRRRPDRPGCPRRPRTGVGSRARAGAPGPRAGVGARRRLRGHRCGAGGVRRGGSHAGRRHSRPRGTRGCPLRSSSTRRGGGRARTPEIVVNRWSRHAEIGLRAISRTRRRPGRGRRARQPPVDVGLRERPARSRPLVTNRARRLTRRDDAVGSRHERARRHGAALPDPGA